MRWIAWLFVAMLSVSTANEAAAKRIALVIGNNNYENLPTLRKAVNDARSMVDVLSELGFEVVSGENLTRRETNRKLAEFEGRIAPGDEAFFYFSGHGVAIDGENYLIPGDMPQPQPGEEDLVELEAHAVGDLVERIRRKGARTAFFVLDACRDNPFATKGIKSIGATKGMTRIAAPQGVFLLYAADYGQAALDRLSDADPDPNSVFTRKLVPALRTPGLSQVDIAKRVQIEVGDLASTVSHTQFPTYDDKIRGEVVLNPAADPVSIEKQIVVEPVKKEQVANLPADEQEAGSTAAGGGTFGTVDFVRARGTLNCGITIDDERPTFAWFDPLGEYQGFDAEICRAVAVAVLGDPSSVRFTPISLKSSYLALHSGEIDILPRVSQSAFTLDRLFSSDTDGLEFVGANFHDSLGFIIRKDLGVSSAKELDGASVCVLPGTRFEEEIDIYFRANSMRYETLGFESAQEAAEAYEAGRCDVHSAYFSELVSTRARFDQPDDHIILPEVMSTAMYGPVVRVWSDDWPEIVAMILNGLILAEEAGINQDNVGDFAVGAGSSRADRLLGVGSTSAPYPQLAPDWAVHMLRATGNYGEIFDRTLGEHTPLQMPRGVNGLRADGGLLVSRTQ